MLKQRVITAVVLLALLLPALFAAVAWPFAVLTLVLIGAAGWEWGRLNQAGARRRSRWACCWRWPVPARCGSAGPRARRPGPGGRWRRCGSRRCLRPARRAGRLAAACPVVLRWVLGLLMLWAAWLALANARSIGINFILSVFCLVWVADIAAYFGGRAFGRRKLAPAISPGKSWEGVWSGMAGVLRAGRRCGAGSTTSQPVDSPSLLQPHLTRSTAGPACWLAPCCWRR